MRLPHARTARRARHILAAVLTVGAATLPCVSRVDAATPPMRAIVFPVDGPATFTDTYGACRDGCTRKHEGQDLMAAKMTPLVAAVAGEVTWLRIESEGNSGNALRITDADGWHYLYMHVNNDTPGSDDARNPAAWRFAPGIQLGSLVKPGQLIGWVGDSGNAESTAPHLHFEIRRPDSNPINAYESLLQAARLSVPPRFYAVYKLSRTNAVRPWSQPGAKVLACDVDGDGDDEPVTRVGGAFFWRKSFGPNITHALGLGVSTDIPVCGDWNGDGIDTFGLFRDGMWYLRNRTTGPGYDVKVWFGQAGDVPVVGDWKGRGIDGIGIVRGSLWMLRDTRWSGTTNYRFAYGLDTDTKLVGDWDGDGDDSPGVRSGTTNKLRYALVRGTPDLVFPSGKTADVPVPSDMDGDGDDSVSLWRSPPVPVTIPTP